MMWIFTTVQYTIVIIGSARSGLPLLLDDDLELDLCRLSEAVAPGEL